MVDLKIRHPLAFIFVSDIKSLFLTFEHFISLFLFCFTAQEKKKKFDPRGKEIIASNLDCQPMHDFYELLGNVKYTLKLLEYYQFCI